MGDHEVLNCWETNCIKFLEKGSGDRAVHLAEENILLSKASTSHFIWSLFNFVASENRNSVSYYASENILKYICLHCPVDDIVVDLIETCSDSKDQEKFRLFLELFVILLGRESTRKEIFLEWCLSHARLYLRRSFSNDCPTDYLGRFNLWHAFISQIIIVFSPLSEKNKNILCISLLDEIGKEIGNEPRLIAIKSLLAFSSDPLDLLAAQKLSNGDIISDNSLALLFDLVFSSNDNIYPAVYAYSYLFSSLEKLFCKLLSDSDLDKVKLAVKLITLLSPHINSKWTVSDLTPSTSQLFESLNYVMVYSEDKNIRLNAFKAFQLVLECHDVKAQYHIFLGFRPHISHAGTLGLIISKMKQCFDKYIKSVNLPGLEYFSGKLLLDIIKLYGFLTNGGKTDIVGDADQILAALNLFWYLLILHKRGVHSLTSFIPELMSEYLTPLKQLVKITLDNCERELARIRFGEGAEEMADVTLNNLPIPNISDEDKIKSIYCARNATELIKTNLDRILNLFDNL